MGNPEERRVHARLSLDERYTLRFQLEGQVFRGVTMTNLSVGGLGLKMDQKAAEPLQTGVVLKGMVLEHPALPQVKVEGVVRHVMGRNAGNSEGPVLVGVQFVDPPEMFVRQLEAYIEKRTRS